jgi:outer membrane immunogenic protein
MLRSLLLSTALLTVAGAALADDLPYRGAPAPIAAPVFTWTGFYVGLNAGAGFNGGDRGYSDFGYGGPNYSGSIGSNNDAGFTGGAQAGYNMQFGAFVAGIEADINYLDRGNGGSSVVNPAVGINYNLTHGDSNNWFGTVRGRLGFAFDRALILATGGWAYGGKIGGVGGTYNGVLMTSTGNSDSNSGWVLGGGVEYAFTNAWSVKLEYLHLDLGDKTQRLFTSPTTGIDVKTDNKFDVVRAGVNFRF